MGCCTNSRVREDVALTVYAEVRLLGAHMTRTFLTLAQEAREYTEGGSARIGPETPQRVLIYLARQYVLGLERNRLREASRKFERQVDGQIRLTTEPPRRSSAEIEEEIYRRARKKAWEAVFGTRFSLADGTDTTWGAATIAQHDARALSQRRHASSTLDDARMHELAASDLRRFGVNSLAEL